jgi:transposase-like protein
LTRLRQDLATSLSPEAILSAYRQRKHTVAEICRTVGISKPTLYAYVREAGISAASPHPRGSVAPTG